ncbi:MAG: hypothetical protein ACKVZH_21965 [Blastocatellia bacterium]
MAEILVGLLFALGIITVIGHAIWWMVAAIFRAVFGASPEPAKPVPFTSQCAECGASLKLNDDFCSACGRSQKAKPDPLADLAMTARQMDRFLNLGKIDAAIHASVMAAIEEERERLTQPLRPTQSVKPVIETSPVEPIAEPKPVVIPTPEPVFTPSPVFNRETNEQREPEPIRAQPEPPKEPRRSFAEMLETFMEESSIRWGEIVGGLLIIGCSLALVISLWSQITAVPLLKFSVFVGITAGLFGIGFYSAFRWRLPTTSLGALTISTLLVPLNFLAMTAFSQTADPNSPIILGGEIAALGLFLSLVYQAAKVILPGNSWTLSGATLLPSAAMLMAKHWQDSGVAIVWLGVIPMVVYWLTTGAMLRQANEDSEDNEEHERRANRIFLMLGVATFSALLPFGLLLIKSGIFAVMAHRFAAFISLLGVPAIACGLTLRTNGQFSGKTKTAATSIALLGGLLAFGGLALAWPRLWPLAIGTLINCAISAVVAWRFRLKSAHVAAIGFFTLAYLLVASERFGGLPAWSDDGGRLIASLFTRATGLAWLTLFVLFAVAAELWRRFNRQIESRIYEFAAVVSAFFSLLILSLHGFGRAGDAQQLSLVYLFYTVAAFVIAWRRKWFIASWVGLSLSLLTILQTFAFKFGYQLSPYHPVRLSLLTYASLATVVSVVLRKRSFEVEKTFTRPAKRAALMVSVLVAPFVLFGGWMTLDQLTIRVFWLAAIWLVLSVANCWPLLFTAFQALLAIGVVSGVAAIFDASALPSHLSWSDPVRLQAQGIALALMCLGWIAVRLKVSQMLPPEGRATNVMRLLFPRWPKVDQVVVVLVWLLLVVLSLGSVGLADGRLSFVSDFVIRAQGVGSWLLMLALALVFVVSLWERFRRRLPLALMTLLACACLLLAGRFQIAVPSWPPAISFALAALPILFRDQLRRACERFRWPQMNEASAGLASLARAEALALFAAPVVALTVGMFWLGYDPVSLAGRLEFLAPLVVVSLTLAAHAVRERSAMYAFAGGLLLNLAVTLGCLLNPAIGFVTALQANIMTSAVVSLVWLALKERSKQGNLDAASISEPSLILRAQIAVTLLVSLSLLFFADVRIAFEPAIASQTAATIGSGWGWLATGLAAAAWFGLRKARLGGWLEHQNVDSIGVALLAVVSLIVCSLSRTLDGWAAYHVLLIGVAASAWMMFALRYFKQLKVESLDSTIGWATALGALEFVLAVRGVEAPGSFWWTVGSFASLSLLFGWMAIALKRRSYVYLSAPFGNVIASMLFVRHFDMLGDGLPFVAANIVVLSLVSLLWLWLERKWMREAIGDYPFHRQSLFVLLPTVCLLSGFHWLVKLIDFGPSTTAWLNWLAIASVAALLVAHFRETNFLLSLRGLHLLGGTVVLEAVCLFPIKDSKLPAVTLASFSIYALIVSWLWKWLSAESERVGITNADAVVIPLRSWILTWNGTLTAVVVAASVAATLPDISLALRLLVTTAAFALPIGFALMVRSEQDRGLAVVCGRLGFLNAVLWSWAWLTPFEEARSFQVINRLVIVMLLIEAVLIAYRLVVVRRVTGDSLWRKCLRMDLPALAAIGLMALAVVLVVEFEQFVSFGAVFIGWAAIVAVLLTLIGVCLIGIAFAVLPGEDPFDLNERGRMRYVYAAEVFLALTFAHLRMTMPWMFGGFFARFWPIGVMLLAFAGAGLSEVFRRQGRIVLAEPLGKTGVVLPLLPVIGFWSLNSEVPYSGLLLLVGLFYGALSVMRHSFAFGILAAAAGNAGLWHFLNGAGGLAFYEHPQLWLIPAALSVLVAARLHRDSLSAEQMNAIRYGALVMIYVSSTADIFINGVTDSPWLPIVLAVLAVAGVIAGLMLRIRAFLFLGTAFLLLSMLTMIWSASVNLQWTWLWYVTGIGFGVLIIYTVAMFERKREQMLGFVERLKQWQ